MAPRPDVLTSRLMPDASVAIRLSPDCRRFLLDNEPPKLPAELRSVLEGAETLRSDGRTCHVIVLSPLETAGLVEHVLALRDALLPNDPRDALREQCMAAVIEAMRQARGA